jgi:hypothetical protein
VLATTIGFSKLPDKFKSALNPEGKFSHTPYNFPTLIKVSEQIVRQAVKRSGGRIEKTAAGKEVLVIPVKKPKPSSFEQCWEAGPVANSRFTEEEMAKITMGAHDISAAVKKIAPGWTISKCGADMDPGLRAEHGGRKNVLMTHPLNKTVPCVLSRTVSVPKGKVLVLSFYAGHHPGGDWELIVKANGKELVKKMIGEDFAKNGWAEFKVALMEGGKDVKLELLNKANNWSSEAGYWDDLKITYIDENKYVK